MSKIVETMYVAELDKLYEIDVWHSIYCVSLLCGNVYSKLTFREPIMQCKDIVLHSFRETKYKVTE